MLSDPIAPYFPYIGPISLPRISISGTSADYADTAHVLSEQQVLDTELATTNDFLMSIAHTKSKRKRSVVRLDHNGVFPSLTSVNSSPASMSTYLVIDRPIGSYSDLAVNTIVSGLLEFCVDVNPSNIPVCSAQLLKVINGES